MTASMNSRMATTPAGLGQPRTASAIRYEAKVNPRSAACPQIGYEAAKKSVVNAYRKKKIEVPWPLAAIRMVTRTMSRTDQAYMSPIPSPAS
jgi:hypothetical protein